jgi:hypothetical protein
MKIYDATVSWPGFSGTTFSCPQEATIISFDENMAPVICNSNGITLVSVGLIELTLTITWDNGSYTQTLYPDYEVVAPQGSDCEPQCLIGNATLEIP